MLRNSAELIACGLPKRHADETKVRAGLVETVPGEEALRKVRESLGR